MNAITRELGEVIETPKVGQFVSFPNSPFELYQPYPPAGDQPERSEEHTSELQSQ